MVLIKLVEKTFMVCRKSTNTIKVFPTHLLSFVLYIHISVTSVSKRILISFKLTDHQEWHSLATIMYHLFKFEITLPFQAYTCTALSWPSNEGTGYVAIGFAQMITCSNYIMFYMWHIIAWWMYHSKL